MRVNLSVAIVAMTENRTIVLPDGKEAIEQDFNWSSRERGVALAAFFYGYITTQFIGGFIAAKFGGSLVRISSERGGKASNLTLRKISKSLSRLLFFL